MGDDRLGHAHVDPYPQVIVGRLRIEPRGEVVLNNLRRLRIINKGQHLSFVEFVRVDAVPTEEVQTAQCRMVASQENRPHFVPFSHGDW